jgi:hypothetical protein
MTRTEQQRAGLISGWLDEGPTELSPHVRDGVLAALRVTRQAQPLWRPGPGIGGSHRQTSFVTVALAAVAVAALAITGIGLVGEGPSGSATASPTSKPASKPTAPAGPQATDVSYRDIGFIGLPPPEATPSTAATTTLVASYRLPRRGDGPFYRGAGYLYADGRLVWIEYLEKPPQSTGYLQQWLTETGIDLVDEAAFDMTEVPDRLEVSRLVDVLPASAWRDSTIRPYVPRAFGVCLFIADAEDPFRAGTPTAPFADRLEWLPREASRILSGNVAPARSVSYENVVEYCRNLSVEDARALDAALRDGELQQDAWRGSSLLNYYLDIDGDGPETWLLHVWFEPVLPDGYIECTSCG